MVRVSHRAHSLKKGSVAWIGWLVYVVAWAPGQLRVNFTRIHKVFTKSPESRSDEGKFENTENASEINLSLPEGTCDYLFIT